MTTQWLRTASLVVADQSGNGVELAGPDLNNVLRIRFTVYFQIGTTPAALKARIYNLSPQTVNKIVGLANANPPTSNGVFSATAARVILKCGYVGSSLGLVFTGLIYQLRIGKERNTDSYLDIFAADGDLAHNWSICAFSLDKGYTTADVYKKATATVKTWGVQPGTTPDGLRQVPSPRGKVVVGMTRDVLTDLGNSNNFTWNIVNQEVVALPKYTFLDGEALVVNSSTGMIGVPEQTEEGISVTTLLNPQIRWGTQIYINATDISRFVIKEPSSGAGALSPNIAQAVKGAYLPAFNADGYYVVLQVTHQGDTRGNEWYSHMICLSIDKSGQLPQSVPPIPLPPPIAD